MDFFPIPIIVMMKLDLSGDIMKNKAIYLLCAVCLAMTACGKTTGNNTTEEITTITEVTETEKAFDTSESEGNKYYNNYFSRTDFCTGIFLQYQRFCKIKVLCIIRHISPKAAANARRIPHFFPSALDFGTGLVYN